MQEDKTKNTELQILLAAEEEFSRVGLAGARTQSIAAAAGVTHAMLHYYYRTKEQLFMRVLDRKRDELFNSLVEAFGADPEADIVGRILTAMTRHFDFFAANPNLPRFMLTEVLPNRERLESFLDGLRPNWMHLAAQYQAELNAAADAGQIARVDFFELFADIFMLNVMSVLTVKAFSLVSGMSEAECLIRRKTENTEIIRKRLQP